MIQKEIRDRIAYQFGKKIRYPKDCFALAYDIAKKCNENISPATLMRLFGITKTNSQPRLFTLDVIALYCGFETWDDFAEAYNLESIPFSEQSSLKQVEVAELSSNCKVCSQKKEITLSLSNDNTLEVCFSEISDIIIRRLVDSVVVNDVYLVILESLEKNSIGKLFKVDTAKLVPM